MLTLSSLLKYHNLKIVSKRTERCLLCIELKLGVLLLFVEGCRQFIFHVLSSFIECESGHCCRFTARLSRAADGV